MPTNGPRKTSSSPVISWTRSRTPSSFSIRETATCSRTAASATSTKRRQRCSRSALSPFSKLPDSGLLLRLRVDRDVRAAEARERLALPAGPAALQGQPGNAGHRVELSRPGVSELDGKRLDSVLGKDVVLGAESLRDYVVDVEGDSVGVGTEGNDGLAEREALEARYPSFDHEAASAPEMGGGVLEARDLR